MSEEEIQQGRRVKIIMDMASDPLLGIKLYTSKEVLELLIRCKDRFGGSELYDQVSDSEVKEWFNENKDDD